VASWVQLPQSRDLIERRMRETIRFYGTPAEEKFFGKLWMIWIFNVDVMLDCPADETSQ
jgi:aminobenzoyl-glutamate utilization protein B